MEYVGSHIDFFKGEYLRIKHIPAQLCQIEPELYQTKWWDYKPLHPMQATYLFAECYRIAVKNSLRRRIDFYRASNYWGMKERDFLDLNKIGKTGMWKARQAADKYGIPYDVWCESAMKYAEKNLWRYVPSPHHLYGDKVKEENQHFMVSMVDYIKECWRKIRANQFLIAHHDFYRTENWCGHKYQIDHLRFLKMQLLRSTNKPMIVAELISERRVMTPGHVQAIFGEKAQTILSQAQAFMSNSGETL